MDNKGLNRRSTFGLSLGALALGGLAVTPSPAATGLDLEDPKMRVMARAKAIGSIAEETVYTFYRLHLYGYFNDGALVPFFTMNNLSITHWKPLADGRYQGIGAECGVYCHFDTDEVLTEWENPITHEKRPVWEFLGGPLKAVIDADGVLPGGVASLMPKSLRMEVLGDTLFVPSQSDRSYPSPYDPKVWPKDSPGAISSWDSHFLYGAKVADIIDPRLTSAPAFCQFQNFGSWHPWLGMGSRPGRTYGKAYGSKLKSLDQVPATALAGIRQKTPEIFDFDRWTRPHIEFDDYKASHTPA